MALIRPKDTPPVTGITAGDKLLLDGATVRSILFTDLEAAIRDLTAPLALTAAANTGLTLKNSGSLRGIFFNTNDTALSIGTTSNHPVDFYSNNVRRFGLSAGGVVDVGGDTVATLTAAQVLTGKTINASNNTISNLTTTMFAANVIDTDGNLGANSNTRIPTQAAVRTAINALLGANDAEVYKGLIDCSANPNYPAGDAGHVYRVSVAGKIGGAAGVNVEINDRVQCIVDGSVAGNQAAVGANWWIVQGNIDGAVVGPTGSTGGNVATFNGATGKLIQDSGKALPAGVVVGTTDAQALTNKTISGAANTLSNIGNGSLSNMAAYTLKGNATNASAAPTDIDISALALKASPTANDIVLLLDSAASNAMKRTTVSAIAAAGSVGSFNGRTGAVSPQAGDYPPSLIGAFAKVKVQVFTASGTYTPSAGCIAAIFEAIGGGGAGGGVASPAASQVTFGAGGGAGGRSLKYDSAPSTKAIVIGAGGAAGAAGGGMGGSGGTTTIGSGFCQATGGGGGAFAGSTAGGGNCVGGLGGTGSLGDVNEQGQAGIGAFGITAAGVFIVAGAGGSSSGHGGGGRGAVNPAAGGDGGLFGGGGGGAASYNGGGAFAGGKGGDGGVIVIEFCNQ